MGSEMCIRDRLVVCRDFLQVHTGRFLVAWKIEPILSVVHHLLGLGTFLLIFLGDLFACGETEQEQERCHHILLGPEGRLEGDGSCCRLHCRPSACLGFGGSLCPKSIHSYFLM